MVTYGYFALTGREGMGLGDYRLMAMVGAYLGWRSLLFLLMASAAQGIAFALFARWTGLEDQLPKLDPDEAELGASKATTESDAPHSPVTEEAAPDATGPLPSADEHNETEETFRHMAIPFGPFIALSALEWLVFEPWLMQLFERYLFGS